MSNINSENQKGVSILYVVFITGVLLAIAFGISGILLTQIKMLSEIGHSTVAFYAADSGIERVLINRHNPDNIAKTDLPNNASYEVLVTEGGIEDCLAEYHYCIKSIGTYKGVKRAIEISY